MPPGVPLQEAEGLELELLLQQRRPAVQRLRAVLSGRHFGEGRWLKPNVLDS
jgi:hypothetical protein